VKNWFSFAAMGFKFQWRFSMMKKVLFFVSIFLAGSVGLVYAQYGTAN